MSGSLTAQPALGWLVRSLFCDPMAAPAHLDMEQSPMSLRNRPQSRMPSRHHIDRYADQIADTVAGAPDDLLSSTDLAQWLGVSVQWLEIGRVKGYGPAYVRIAPRRVRYRRADVLSWLEQRSYQSTADYASHSEVE